MNPLNIPQIVRKARTKQPYKKPASVKQLEAMMADNFQTIHPELSKISDASQMFKMRDDKANGLTNCITTYLKLKGHYVTRINNQGTYSAKLGRYIPSTARKGLADIECLINSQFIAIEVKIGKDRQSEAQKSVEVDIIKSGGLYFIARDFSSFVEWLINIDSK